MEDKVQKEIDNLMIYYPINPLAVYPKKSTVILFKNKLGKNKYKINEEWKVDFNFLIAGTKIRVANNSEEDKGCVNILGIYLYQDLNFDYQASMLLSIQYI